MGKFRRAAVPAAIVLVAVLGAACAAPPDTPPTSALDGTAFEPPAREPSPSEGCGTGAVLPDGRSNWSFAVGGTERTTFVAGPDAPAGQPLPVVLSFHPFGLGNEFWDDYSDLSQVGTDRGYVVVTPLGSTDLLLPRWTVRGGLPGADDAAFVDAILARLGAEACIDTSRIYATGFSAGAAFSVSLSCERPGLLAAVAGSGGTNLALPCPDGPPVDALVLHGNEDPIVPPAGQTGALPPAGISVDDVVASFAARGACGDDTATPVRPTVELRRFSGCVPGGEVASLSFTGGHTWPGKDGLLFAGLVTGATNFEFDATLTVLDWFDAH